VKKGQNDLFWGSKPGVPGCHLAKQLENTVSLSLGIYGPVRGPQGPYMGSGPLKTRYFWVPHEKGYLDFEESDLLGESL